MLGINGFWKFSTFLLQWSLDIYIFKNFRGIYGYILCSLLLRDMCDFFGGGCCVVKVWGNYILGKNNFLKK